MPTLPAYFLKNVFIGDSVMYYFCLKRKFVHIQVLQVHQIRENIFFWNLYIISG